MSGTSCDGLDIAYCEFWKEGNKWSYKLNYCLTLTGKLFDSILPNVYELPLEKLIELDRIFGDFTGKSIIYFLKQHNISSSEIDFICSHGHTVLHSPQEGYTLQNLHPLPVALGHSQPEVQKQDVLPQDLFQSHHCSHSTQHQLRP